VSLGAVRETLMAEAERDAGRMISAAREEAERQVARARQKADDEVDRARAAARAEADERLAMERAATRREARRVVLETRERIRQSLIEASILGVVGHRGSRDYQRFLERVERHVQVLLGEDAEITRDPPEGGVIGRCGQRRLDYTVPAVVERVIDALGADLEELWS
jgi:vacuolar-type H+-ATPase subunit H